MSRSKQSQPQDDTDNESLTDEERTLFEELRTEFDDDHDVAKLAEFVLQSDNSEDMNS